jgi:hypothetical protein
MRLLLFSDSRSSFLLTCYRYIPRRGRTYTIPRGPFCQPCLQRGHPLTRYPLRKGLMSLGHTCRWCCNFPRKRRESRRHQKTQAIDQIGAAGEYGYTPAVAWASELLEGEAIRTIVPPVATMQLSSLCLLCLPHLIHVQSVWRETHPS